MATKTIVGIKRLWYTDPFTEKFNGSALYDMIQQSDVAKEITNVHGSTWVYEEAEPTTTDYINQLTGKIYYRDNEPGSVQISFSVGQYDYETKAALQGGTATETSWERDDSNGLIYKGIIAQTKDGTYIVFPNASIVARGGMVEDKVLGLMLTAVAMEAGDSNPSERWYDESEVKESL